MKTILPSSRSRTRDAGFTLVELLVVIAIIGILAAMILPVLSAAKVHAQKVQARLQISDIVTAIEHYDSAYGRFPVSREVQNAATASGNSDFTYGGTFQTDTIPQPIGSLVGGSIRTNSEVIAILMDLTNYPSSVGGGWTMNTNYQSNPQQTLFLNAKLVSDTETWPGVGPDLVYRDPWGNPYVISMDLNYDENCEDAVYSTNAVSGGGLGGLSKQPDGNWAVHGKVMVWSAGPNKKVDPADPANDKENKDNVTSWQ